MERQFTKKESQQEKKHTPNRRKTHEQYVKECKEKAPNIRIRSKYVKAKEPVECECLICNFTWSPLAGSIIQGHGCPHCADLKTGKRCKKTPEQYKRELAVRNPSIQALSPYDGASTKIEHMCTVCGHKWFAQPANILSGTGCPRCANRFTMTNDEWLKRFYQNNTHDITPISPYINSHTKVICQCNVCGFIFSSEPSVLIKNSNCPKCAIKINARKATKDHSLFVKEMEIINPDILIVSNYQRADKKVECQCKNCEGRWFATPSHLLHGTGCPYCYGHIKISLENFMTSIKDSSVEIIGELTNFSTRVLCRCKECGNEWYANPENLINGSGCPRCKNESAGLNRRKSKESFSEDMKSLHPEIELLSDYTHSHSTVKFKVLKTGEIREATPSALYASRIYGTKNYKGEFLIADTLDRLKIKYIHGKRFSDLRGKRNPLEYDFYLPEFKTVIEFQGEQHLRPVDYFGGEKQFEIQCEHDQKKREYARKHKMKFIEILYHQIDEVETILKRELKFDTAETAG